MEFFYRTMRQQYKVLMDHDKPIGGQWNFDADNRKGFGKGGPQNVPRALVFEPDVRPWVNRRSGRHQGHWKPSIGL